MSPSVSTPTCSRRCALDPDTIPVAIEEILRYDGPVPHATFRYATEPVEIAGTTIPAAGQVVIALAAANRDAARYPNAETLDIERADHHHLAFGHGIHACLGAALARMEAHLALGTLLHRFPELRLAVSSEQLHWGHGDGLVLRGLTDLPIIPGPARPRSLAAAPAAIAQIAGAQRLKSR